MTPKTPAPKASQLRKLLDRPDARPKVSRAVVSLLATEVLSIGVLGALVVWHLSRRARLIRDRLAPPRLVRLPDLTPLDARPKPTEPGTEIEAE